MSGGDSGAGARGASLLASLQRLLATLIEILQTRVAIIATEFEEERERIRELIVFGFLAMFFVSIGLTLVTVFIVMLLWENNLVYMLGGCALLYLALGLIIGLVLHRRLKSRPRLFATTLTELAKDRDQLAR